MAMIDEEVQRAREQDAYDRGYAQAQRALLKDLQDGETQAAIARHFYESTNDTPWEDQIPSVRSYWTAHITRVATSIVHVLEQRDE
jgi:hypothetical protein